MHHQAELLEKENTGVRALLKSHAVDDLTRLFTLYSAVPSSLPFIASMVQQHIIEIGSGLQDKAMAAAANPSTAPTTATAASSTAPAAATASPKNTYIEDLMRLHETYFDMILTCFGGHAAFQKALKEAFEQIINKNRGTDQSSAAGQTSRRTQKVLGGREDMSSTSRRILFRRTAR